MTTEKEYLKIDSDWIRQRIKLKGIKKKDLAELVGCESTQISNWLSGNRKPNKITKKFLWEILN